MPKRIAGKRRAMAAEEGEEANECGAGASLCTNERIHTASENELAMHLSAQRDQTFAAVAWRPARMCVHCIAHGGPRVVRVQPSLPQKQRHTSARDILRGLACPDGHLPSRTPLHDRVQLIDTILDSWSTQIGPRSFAGYRNHCYRVYHFTLALHAQAHDGLQALTPEQRDQVAVAVAFHDIGIWTDPLQEAGGASKPNIDYIDPSVRRATEWLAAQGKPDNWTRPVSLMISEHHKLLSHPGSSAEDRLIEVFRQADLVDFSLGFVRNGLSRALVAQVREHWPNAGFHAGLVTLLWDRIKSHPLNPMPMMKV